MSFRLREKEFQQSVLLKVLGIVLELPEEALPPGLPDKATTAAHRQQITFLRDLSNTRLTCFSSHIDEGLP
jgi:hypothetical protein